MAKEFRLPHLTSEELSERDSEENLLNRELVNCWRGDEFDGERAENVLSDYAVRIFRVLHGAYKTRPAFQDEWLEKIKILSIYRTLRIYAGHSAYGMPTTNDLADSFEEAIDAHLASLPKKVSLDMANRYAKAGIDIASGGPLLQKMASAWEQSPRPGVFAPIRRGSKPRFPAQVKSETAARKVEAYMDKRGLNQTEFAGMANTTDKTLRKFLQTGSVKRSILTGIASAMGISKEELLS